MSDKTEEPTPKRLRKAAEEGDSPQSSFATQSVTFLCAIALAPAAIEALVLRSSADLRAAIGRAADVAPTVTLDPSVLASSVVGLVAPIVGAAAVAGAVMSVVQSGGAIATKKLTPKLERLNPIAGLKGLFSFQRVVSILRAAFFAAVVAWLARSAIVSHATDLANVVGRPAESSAVAGALAIQLVRRAAIFGLFIAVVDIVLTRRSWKKKLMMSKDEVKREHKESEGDPQQKAARERAHHEMLAAATVGNVRTASVVVVNPTHIACALRYDEGEGDETPVVVAAGHGDLAAKIIEAARQYGVPILRDVPLARALVELEIGAEIPESLYEAVAEILREAWEENERDAGIHEGGTP